MYRSLNFILFDLKSMFIKNNHLDFLKMKSIKIEYFGYLKKL